MKTFLSIFLLLSLSVSLQAQEPYGAKNDPFRVAMRDMKKEYKVLESFEEDASLSKKAVKSCKNLIELFNKAQKMKPAFLKPEQHKDYDKHYTDMIACLNKHLENLHSGKTKAAQNVYSDLDGLKKKAHDQFSKQAKKYRGAE